MDFENIVNHLINIQDEILNHESSNNFNNSIYTSNNINNRYNETYQQYTNTLLDLELSLNRLSTFNNNTLEQNNLENINLEHNALEPNNLENAEN